MEWKRQHGVAVAAGLIWGASWVGFQGAALPAPLFLVVGLLLVTPVAFGDTAWPSVVGRLILAAAAAALSSYAWAWALGFSWAQSFPGLRGAMASFGIQWAYAALLVALLVYIRRRRSNAATQD